MEVSKLNLDARSPRCLKAQSSLVRRLVQARDDPAKRRMRHWLSDINDERLLAFGLTQEDIALLHRVPRRKRPGSTSRSLLQAEGSAPHQNRTGSARPSPNCRREAFSPKRGCSFPGGRSIRAACTASARILSLGELAERARGHRRRGA
jgi:hypothetical protein